MSDHLNFDPPSGPPQEPTSAMPAGAYPPPPSSPPPPFTPPSMSAGPLQSGPTPSPMQPSGGGRGKLVAVGLGAAVLAGAAVFGVTQVAGGDDDDADTIDQPSVSVTLPADAQAALDDAQQAADRAVADANEMLDDVLASIPSVPGVPGVPQGEPSDNDAPRDNADDNNPSDVDVAVTMPNQEQLDQIGECLGLDLGDVFGQLGALDPSIFDVGELPGQLDDFGEMTPEELAELDVAELLEEMFSEMNRELGELDASGVPPMSVPFDLDIFGGLDLGELGEIGTMSPEEIQELIESQLGDLEGSIGSIPMPPIEMPAISIPPISIPMTPLDATALEDCLAGLGE